MKYSERRKLKVSRKVEINEVNNQIVSGLQEIEARSRLQSVGLAVRGCVSCLRLESCLLSN